MILITQIISGNMKYHVNVTSQEQTPSQLNIVFVAGRMLSSGNETVHTGEINKMPFRKRCLLKGGVFKEIRT